VVVLESVEYLCCNAYFSVALWPGFGTLATNLSR
jgi:hypothetical protein